MQNNHSSKIEFDFAIKDIYKDAFRKIVTKNQVSDTYFNNSNPFFFKLYLKVFWEMSGLFPSQSGATYLTISGKEADLLPKCFYKVKPKHDI